MQPTWEEWKGEVSQILRRGTKTEGGWDWTQTLDWEEMREAYDRGDSAETAAGEELNAMSDLS